MANGKRIPVPSTSLEPSPQANQPEAPKKGKTGKKAGRKARDRDAQSAVSVDHGGKNIRIRYYIPSVAKYCARVIIQYAMDYTAATRAILSVHNPDVATQTISEVAANMEQSTHIQAALETELNVHGLDETSKSAFVKEMWDWLRSPNEELAKKAAQILGRGFIAEKVGAEKPESLPIAGLGDAISSMMRPIASSPASPTENSEVETVTMTNMLAPNQPTRVRVEEAENGTPEHQPDELDAAPSDNRHKIRFLQRPNDSNDKLPDA